MQIQECEWCEGKGKYEVANGPDDFDVVKCPYCVIDERED